MLWLIQRRFFKNLGNYYNVDFVCQNCCFKKYFFKTYNNHCLYFTAWYFFSTLYNNVYIPFSPSYWYFDLPPKDCPPIPEPDLSFLNSTDANNSTCRIYFNLCQSMYFQCAGSVCVNYLNTEDYINFLGETVSHPFHESKWWVFYCSLFIFFMHATYATQSESSTRFF